MNPDSLVPSLALCRELKACGWPQEEAYFCWYEDKNGNKGLDINGKTGWKIIEKDGTKWTASSYAAPTAECLLRRLP